MRALDPPSSEQAANDRDALLRRAELIISGVLRGGVLLSAGLIAFGVVLFYLHYFAEGGASAKVANPHSLGDVAHGLLTLDPVSVIATGLLVLLATPVVRVAVSIVAFALERDRTYVVITSLVLLILLISFFSGRGGG